MITEPTFTLEVDDIQGPVVHPRNRVGSAFDPLATHDNDWSTS